MTDMRTAFASAASALLEEDPLAYATTVRPFDGSGLRSLAASGSVVLAEPYLAGTSAHAASEALAGRPTGC